MKETAQEQAPGERKKTRGQILQKNQPSAS
jgi:hypothetical protein